MSEPLVAIDDRVSVAGQLQPGDMQRIAAEGYVAVVNNRPEGEALFGQPRTADMKQAAETAGLIFLDLPFSGSNVGADQVRAFANLLAERPGRVVAYCRSGRRSSLLWAAAAIADGRSLTDVLTAARRAGQDLEPASETITTLGQAARR